MSPLASRTPRRRGRLGRLIALAPHRRALLAEAIVQLALAAAAIRLRPFRQVVAMAARPLGNDEPMASAALAEIVVRAAQLVPFRAVCFQQGVAFQRMARRRGIDARLHYGVGTELPEDSGLVARDKGLHAHVWITVGGVGVLGHEQAVHFRQLLRSPP